MVKLTKLKNTIKHEKNIITEQYRAFSCLHP